MNFNQCQTFAPSIDCVFMVLNIQKGCLKSTYIDTTLGRMVAVADQSKLYLLEFVGRKGLSEELQQLQHLGFSITEGEAAPLLSIALELQSYFAGEISEFTTPYRVFGTVFQQQVWQALCTIPFGQTRTYAQQAQLLGRPKAYRAVANANGANQLALIIPCHRVVASGGGLGGYGGGVELKRWLLEHERLIHG